MIRWNRGLAATALAMTLTLALPPAPALAQEPAPENAEGGGQASQGRPLDGYIATSVLAALALFIAGKSARR
jgi:hypothetical protein